MKLNAERLGEIIALVYDVLWGLFPIITILIQDKLSALLSLSLSLTFASLFLALVLTIKRRWHEVFDKTALKDNLVSTFFIGILYYLFYFFGLNSTSAGNASIIALSGILFSYLFFHLWRRDFIPKEHIIGAILMAIGAFIVLYPNLHQFHLGDLLILAAAAVTPFGNFYVQKARRKVSSESILFTRCFISAIVIFPLVFLFHGQSSYTIIKSSLIFLAINGIFLLGISKILWVEQIHRMSVMKANAWSSMSSLFTLFFAG